MGKTNEDTVETKPSNDPGSVKRSQLQKFYDQGHSPQEVAEEFNVEVEVVMDVLGLNVQPEDQAPTDKTKVDDNPPAED